MTEFRAFFPERILNNDDQYKAYSLHERKTCLEKGIYGLTYTAQESLVAFHRLYAQIGGYVENQIRQLIQQQEKYHDKSEQQGLQSLLECFYLSRVMGRHSFWRNREEDHIKFYRERWQSITLFLFHNSEQLLRVAHEILPAMENFIEKSQKELKKKYKKVSPVFREDWEDFLSNSEAWIEQTRKNLAKTMVTILRYNQLGFRVNQDSLVLPVLNTMALMGCSNSHVNPSIIRGLIEKFPKTFRIHNLCEKKFSDLAMFIIKWGSEKVIEDFKKLKFFQCENVASEPMKIVWCNDKASLFPHWASQYVRRNKGFFKNIQWGRNCRYKFFNYERIFMYHGFNRSSQCIKRHIENKKNLLLDFHNNEIIYAIKFMDSFNKKERGVVDELLMKCKYSFTRRKTRDFLKKYQNFMNEVEQFIIEHKMLFVEAVSQRLWEMDFLNNLEKVASPDFIQSCRLMIDNLSKVSVQYGIFDKQNLVKNKFFEATNVFKKYEDAVNHKKSFSYLNYYCNSILGYLTPDNIHAILGVNHIIQRKNYPSADDYNQWITIIFDKNKERKEVFEKNMIERYIVLHLNSEKSPMKTDAYRFYKACFEKQADDFLKKLIRLKTEACQFLIAFFSQGKSYLNNEEVLYVNGDSLIANEENAEKAAMNFNRVLEVSYQGKVLSTIHYWIDNYFTGAHYKIYKVILSLDNHKVLSCYVKKILNYHFKNNCVVELIDSPLFKEIKNLQCIKEIINETLNSYLLSSYSFVYEEEIYDFLREFFPSEKEKYIKCVDNMRVNQLSMAIESPIALKEVSSKLKSYIESSLIFPASKQGYESIIKVLQMHSMRLVNPEVITLIINYLGQSSFSTELFDCYGEIRDSLEVLYVIHDVKNRFYNKAISKIESFCLIDNKETKRKKVLLNKLIEKYFFKQMLPDAILIRIEKEFFNKMSEKNIDCVKRQFFDKYKAAFYLKNSISNNVEEILLGNLNHIFLIDENFTSLVNEIMPPCMKKDLAKQIEPFLFSNGVLDETKLIFHALYSFLKEDWDEKYKIIFTWYGDHRDGRIERLFEKMKCHIERLLEENTIGKYHQWIEFYKNFYKNNNKFNFLKNIKCINSRLSVTNQSNVKFFKKGKKGNDNHSQRKGTSPIIY